MNKSASLSVANQVRELAKVHHVTADRDGMSRMAVAITRLADDIVELDVIEQLLVNLKKKGHFNQGRNAGDARRLSA